MSFKINRVYTRSGDAGETSLIDGSRVLKCNSRCQIFGGLDEVSCHLGLAKDSLTDRNLLIQVTDVVEFLQQELFDLGSEIAIPKGLSFEGMLIVGNANVEYLEKLCDFFNAGLPELESFILPGGDTAASHFHVARTVTRRVERELVSFLQTEPDLVSQDALKYFNRLSDLLFVLSRYVLHELNKSVPLWKKGKDRKFPI